MASNAAGCVDYWRREMSGTSRDASRLRPVGLASRHPAAGRTARGRTSVGEGYRMSLGEIALAVARGTLLGCVDRHCVDQIEERCVDGRVPGVGGQRTESEGPAPSCGVAQHTRAVGRVAGQLGPVHKKGTIDLLVSLDRRGRESRGESRGPPWTQTRRDMRVRP